MDCPKYTNKIFVASNDHTREITLNFFHDFPTAEEKEDQVVSGTERVHVCGVTMSADLAGQLYDILNQHLAKDEDK